MDHALLFRGIRGMPLPGIWCAFFYSGNGGGICGFGRGGCGALFWLYSHWSLICVFGAFRAVGGWAVSKVEGSARVRVSPSEVYPADKLQWHFTCGFDFRHSLWLPIAAAFAILKGLFNGSCGNYGSFLNWSLKGIGKIGKI